MPESAPQPEALTTGTYRALRRSAAAALAREPRRHTLAPTELVHEAWMKLRSTELPPGGHGLALAARAMRESLVDHARRRSAQKRGEGRTLMTQASDPSAGERDAYVVALDGALAELAQHDPELARLVELRFFAGFDEDELVRELGLSPRTLKRRWQLAKGWLHQRIQET